MRTAPKPSVVVLAATLVSLALAASAWPVPAQQAPRLTIIGVGTGASCGEWAAAGRSDPELELWVFGFASAIAAGAQLQRGGDPLDGTDAAAIHAWLGDHCRRRTEDPLSAALVRMVMVTPH